MAIGGINESLNIKVEKINIDDNKKELSSKELLDGLKSTDTETKKQAMDAIFASPSFPKELIAILSKDPLNKDAVTILKELVKAEPIKAAELFKRVKDKNKVIEAVNCFDAPPLNNTEKNNVVKFLSEVAKAEGADKYLLKDFKPGKAAEFLFDNLDLADGKNKSETAFDRYDGFKNDALKKACLDHIVAKEHPTEQQKEFSKTLEFNKMEPAEQAKVLHAILADTEDGKKLDLKDVFVLENLNIKTEAFSARESDKLILTPENKKRLLNADGATMFNRAGEYFNAKTAAAVAIHAETGNYISKAINYEYKYPKSTLAERQKAVDMLNVELAEVNAAIERNDDKKMLADLKKIKEQIESYIKDYISEVNISSLVVAVANQKEAADAADKVAELDKAIKSGSVNITKDDLGVVTADFNNFKITTGNLTDYNKKLELADQEIKKILLSVEDGNNQFISPNDQASWDAIKNTLLSLGVTVKSDKVEDIQQVLAELAGKSNFGQFSSYAQALRALRGKLVEQKASVAQIEKYLESSQKIEVLKFENEKPYSDELDNLLKNIAVIVEPYRGLLFKQLISKVEKEENESNENIPKVALTVAKQKILQAENAPSLDYAWHVVKSSLVGDKNLNAHHRVSGNIKIINLHNETTLASNPRSIATNNLTYLLANGKDNYSFDSLSKYNEGTGELKFVKKDDGNYELNVSVRDKDTTLGITISADVAAYLLGRSYVDMAKLTDKEIQKLFSVAAAKHKENYRLRGGKSGQSLAMKVALGDMEDWTNLTGLYIVNKKALAKGSWGPSGSVAITGQGRTELIEQYKETLLPFIARHYAGTDNKYLIDSANGAVNYKKVMDDFLSGKLDIGLTNIYINNSDDHKEIVLLKEKINLLNNNSLIKTIGKPTSEIDIKPEKETVDKGVKEILADIKKIDTKESKTADKKLSKYQKIMENQKKDVSSIRKNRKRSFFSYKNKSQKYFIYNEENKLYVAKARKDKPDYIDNDSIRELDE